MHDNKPFVLTKEERERIEAFTKHVDEINNMLPALLEELVQKDQCPFRPELDPRALGMYHCPLCGEMVVALVGHPRKADGEWKDEDFKVLAELADKPAPVEGL